MSCFFFFIDSNMTMNVVYTVLVLVCWMTFLCYCSKGGIQYTDCGASKSDTLLEENKRSFMWTVYSSICIFDSDLFSEGLSKTPVGSISLTAPSPPLLLDLHPTTTQTKLLFLPQEPSCESEQLPSPGLYMQNKHREKSIKSIQVHTGLNIVGKCES